MFLSTLPSYSSTQKQKKPGQYPTIMKCLVPGEQCTCGINPIAFLKHCMSLDCPSETDLHQRLSQMLPGLFQFYSEKKDRKRFWHGRYKLSNLEHIMYLG